MGSEMSMDMGDDFKPRPGPQQGYQGPGGGAGWGGDNSGKQNGYIQQSSNGYVYNNGGYRAGYGGHNGYAPPQGPPPVPQGGYGHQNDYAPPPGPPPGYHGGYSYPNQYAPPPGPPPGHNGPPPGYQLPPPGYGGKPQGGGGGGDGRSRLNFPRKFCVWSEMAPSGESYMYIGEELGKPAYSAKFPLMTGRLSWTAGSRKENGAPLGEAKDTGLSRSSAVITLPNGFTCDLTKNSMSQMGKTTYTYTVPVDGRGNEAFEWRLKGKLKGGGGGWQLFRQGDSTRPLAQFTDFPGPGSCSKEELGTFEFVGEGASGELGQIWATVTVVAFLKAKQKLIEKQIIKAVSHAV